ncbi:triacylglycerol lipase 2 [Cinnamomum micranthum f. kanehirae]|uniref:Lipase n=1 Tax=Cinnamomum micranthum f. kanehirae TaxID=337451 RepID=A0A3S3PX42_9MAGN|nr:triacylglycerol lipase 2 [Cinnamomum micranthum f. kanehirae]
MESMFCTPLQPTKLDDERMMMMKVMMIASGSDHDDDCGLAYGSRRSDLFMSHAGDMVHDLPDPLLLGMCESFVNPQGYPCKEYQVTTEDGYILSMQNIPGGRFVKGSKGGKRQPVLLQHGLQMFRSGPFGNKNSLGSVLGPDRTTSTGNLLAICVWIWAQHWPDPNSTTDPPKQFNSYDGLTWLLNNPDESLGFILADSGFDVWIANARGTRWSLKHQSLNRTDLAYWAWSLDELVQYELPAIVGFVHNQTGKKMHFVGNSLGALVALASFSEGKLVDMLKSAALPTPIAYLKPYDLSHRSTCCQSFPWRNTVRKGVTTKFDYGSPKANMVHYSQTEPSVYNMSNIPNDLPLFLSYGGQDAISDVYDVQLLLDCLKFHDGDKLTVQFVKDFAHMDFVMGVTAKSIVYNAMIAFFNRY